MRIKRPLLVLSILLMFCIMSFPMVHADGESGLPPWEYRRLVSITGSAGAGTHYQVLINVTYDSDMQPDFDDLRFTDSGGGDQLDYWIQNYTDSSFALAWVNVTADLDSSQSIYMYYGNSAVTTTSNGTNTFNAFFDKDSITGWSLADIDVSTSGDYLRFNNSVNTDVGMATRFDLTTPTDFQIMAQYKQTSLGARDQFIISPCDASTSDRFAMAVAPKDSDQTEWHYYDGSMKLGGSWVEETEFIFTIQVDEGDAVNGLDYRRYGTTWALLDSALNENFALGSPTDCDGLFIGDAGSDAYIDVYIRWMAFRKCIDSEPIPTVGDEELAPNWAQNGIAILLFSIPFDMWGIETAIIILGLVMIPASTVYLAYGVKYDRSDDRLFYGLLLFVVGWGLLIGGIMP